MTRPNSLLLSCFVLFSPVVFAAYSDKAFGVMGGHEIVGGHFGLFDFSDSNKPKFVRAKVVPLIPNQAYGWIIRLRTDKSKIKWREEFSLPIKPATWGPAESSGSRSVSTDGRVSVTEREVSPDRGVILNSWTVAPGDPKGHYVIRVFVEDSLAKTFEFDVQ